MGVERGAAFKDWMPMVESIPETPTSVFSRGLKEVSRLPVWSNEYVPNLISYIVKKDKPKETERYARLMKCVN